MNSKINEFLSIINHTMKKIQKWNSPTIAKSNTENFLSLYIATGKHSMAAEARQGTMLLLICLFQVGFMFAQSQSYDNFDGNKYVHYGARTGVLDTVVKNPAPNKVDTSGKCGLYVRNSTKKFDNIKMSISGKLVGVNEYATYVGNPPQLKMKVYTAAPVGTLVEILLGCKGRNNEYPAGTHSQYQAYTTVTNAWEELVFKFSQIPEGSETSATQIDQLTLLFNPNTSTSDRSEEHTSELQSRQY